MHGRRVDGYFIDVGTMIHLMMMRMVACVRGLADAAGFGWVTRRNETTTRASLTDVY
jgi:hypothetical protein